MNPFTPATLTMLSSEELQQVSYDCLSILLMRNPPTGATKTTRDQISKTLTELAHIAEIESGRPPIRTFPADRALDEKPRDSAEGTGPAFELPRRPDRAPANA